MLYKKSLVLILCLMVNAVFPFLTASALLSAPIDNSQHYLINFIDKQIAIPEGIIKTGYGEYYVFDLTGSKISKDTYEIVYQIFDRYSLAGIVNSASPDENIYDIADNRFHIIRDQVKTINQNLEIGFIPRVLYELIFIRKCIKEDIREGNRCDYAYKGAQKAINKNPEAAEEIKSITATRKCWHLKSYPDEYDNQDECIINYSYRLNNAIVKTLKPKPEGFTFLELQQKVVNEINYLENFYNTCTEDYKQFFIDGKGESLTLNLSPEANAFMGIKSQSDAQILLNALAIECSEVARTSFLLYRGATGNDSIISAKNENESYRLSYGTGLYAGCVYDSDATAFYYMLKEDAKAFVIPVPFEMLNTSVFYIPPTNTMTQLLGTGEHFHAVTKKWKGAMYWLDCSSERKNPKVVESDLDKNEFSEMFEIFSLKAIQLKIDPESRDN
jgi:hypothetical protein